jgi:hypothetical protein
MAVGENWPGKLRDPLRLHELGRLASVERGSKPGRPSRLEPGPILFCECLAVIYIEYIFSWSHLLGIQFDQLRGRLSEKVCQCLDMVTSIPTTLFFSQSSVFVYVATVTWVSMASISLSVTSVSFSRRDSLQVIFHLFLPFPPAVCECDDYS